MSSLVVKLEEKECLLKEVAEEKDHTLKEVTKTRRKNDDKTKDKAVND
jgi:hypothetical protein